MKVQVRFREGSGKVQVRFRKGSETFRECSGKAQEWVQEGVQEWVQVWVQVSGMDLEKVQG